MDTQKRLTRSTQDRMFAGVCGGIAEYLEVDPTLVRLFFAALTLLGSGAGIVMYIVMMLIVPEGSRAEQRPKLKREVNDDQSDPLAVKSSASVVGEPSEPDQPISESETTPEQ